MKNMMKRCFAVMMVLVLCLSLLPINVFAAENVQGYCNDCKKETVLLADKSGYICSSCMNDNVTVTTPEEKPEPEEPVCPHEKTYATYNWRENNHTLTCTSCEKVVATEAHSYDNNGYCVCGAKAPAHEHNYVDGKCAECGAEEPKPEEHVHSWKYTPDHYNYFTHVKTCSTCGATVTEKCTETIVYDPWAGGQVRKCTLCNYWVDSVHEHVWTLKANEDGTHTYTCTDQSCGMERTEECKLKASADAASVACEVCGWVKYNDGTPGTGTDNTCKDGEHEFSTTGTNVSEYRHVVTCLKCGMKNEEACTQGELKDANGKIVSHYCTVCGKTTSVKGENYCDDWKEHDWQTKKEELSEDGKSVLTTQTCIKCGAVQITDICNSPAKVTVHYVYEDSKVEFASDSQSVIKGTYYKFESPESTIEGYEPEVAIVSGTSLEGKDEDIYVVYKKVTPAPTLTIHYHYFNGPNAGKEVTGDYTAQVKAGEEYAVESYPAPLGYYIEKGKETVTGKMGQGNTEETVKYYLEDFTWTIRYVDEKGEELKTSTVIPYTVETVKGLTAPANPEVFGYEVKTVDVTNPNPYELGNVVGKVVYAPIEYKWTINYVDENGNPMEGMPTRVIPFDITSIKTLEGVESPTKSGYTADKTFVEAPTELGDVTVNVVYSLSNDFNLTVVHRYVALDGTVREETQVLGQYKIGDTYTTEPKNEEGYTLSAAPDNASGTFGAEDVNVIYVYTADEPDEPDEPEQPETPDSRPPEERPEERPEDPEEPDPEDPVPPVPPETPEQPETPVTPDPVEIDEPQVPLVEAPELPEETVQPEEPIVVDEPQLPLGELPEEVEIEDPSVPLADVPQTGDVSGAWLAGAALPACSLGLILCMKKREGEED